MELAENSSVFEKAMDVLSEVSADDYNRMLYEARLKEWRDNKSRMDGAVADGVKKRDEQILDLIEKGYSLADIRNFLQR